MSSRSIATSSQSRTRMRSAMAGRQDPQRAIHGRRAVPREIRGGNAEGVRTRRRRTRPVVEVIAASDDRARGENALAVHVENRQSNARDLVDGEVKLGRLA